MILSILSVFANIKLSKIRLIDNLVLPDQPKLAGFLMLLLASCRKRHTYRWMRKSLPSDMLYQIF